MAEESFQERTEKPSPKRLEDAREKGQVPRSRELSTGALLISAAATLMFTGPKLYADFSAFMQAGLQIPRAVAFDSSLLFTFLATPLRQLLMSVAPLIGLLFLVALASPLLLGGWNFSAKAFIPDFSRLNPLSGLGRIFSKHGLIELAKAIAKLLAVGILALWVVWHERDTFPSLVGNGLAPGAAHMGQLLLWTFLVLAAGTLIIVLIDVPFQLWWHQHNLKMTKEELRQEAKESEGDPQVKGRIRSMQREAARKRMMSEVPKADVIVTNPTHYAVALRYKNGTMRAPQVVAKGSDLLAARIRELAADHRVPVLEAPPLARALYQHVEIGHEIPTALYTVVAEVLAYVYQLKLYQKEGGQAPVRPDRFEVPAAMDPLTSA